MSPVGIRWKNCEEADHGSEQGKKFLIYELDECDDVW